MPCYLLWYIVPDLASESPLKLNPVSLWHVPIVLCALPYFLAQKDVPGYLVLASVLKSAISPIRLGSSCWRMVFRNQYLTVIFAHCWCDDITSRAFSGLRQVNRLNTIEGGEYLWKHKRGRDIYPKTSKLWEREQNYSRQKIFRC